MTPAIRPYPWMGFAALAAALMPAPAAALVYTSQSDFLATLRQECRTLSPLTPPSPDSVKCYFQNFRGVPTGTNLGSSASFTGSGFSYPISTAAPTLLTVVTANRFLVTGAAGKDIEIDFTLSPNSVSAVGGNFFTISNTGAANFFGLTLSALYSDGTSETLILPNTSFSTYVGFAAPDNGQVQRLTIIHQNQTIAYTSMDNLLVVPEPSSLLLFGAAGMGWWTAGRRKRAIQAG